MAGTGTTITSNAQMIASYEAALKKKPNDPKLMRQLVPLYSSVTHFSQKRQCIKALLGKTKKADERHSLMYQLGMAYLVSSAYKGDKTQLDKAREKLSTLPRNSIPFALGYAFALYRYGNLPEACNVLDEAYKFATGEAFQCKITYSDETVLCTHSSIKHCKQAGRNITFLWGSVFFSLWAHVSKSEKRAAVWVMYQQFADMNAASTADAMLFEQDCKELGAAQQLLSFQEKRGHLNKQMVASAKIAPIRDQVMTAMLSGRIVQTRLSLMALTEKHLEDARYLSAARVCRFAQTFYPEKPPSEEILGGTRKLLDKIISTFYTHEFGLQETKKPRLAVFHGALKKGQKAFGRLQKHQSRKILKQCHTTIGKSQEKLFALQAEHESQVIDFIKKSLQDCVDKLFPGDLPSGFQFILFQPVGELITVNTRLSLGILISDDNAQSQQTINLFKRLATIISLYSISLGQQPLLGPQDCVPPHCYSNRGQADFSFEVMAINTLISAFAIFTPDQLFASQQTLIQEGRVISRLNLFLMPLELIGHKGKSLYKDLSARFQQRARGAFEQQIRSFLDPFIQYALACSHDELAEDFLSRIAFFNTAIMLTVLLDRAGIASSLGQAFKTESNMLSMLGSEGMMADVAKQALADLILVTRLRSVNAVKPELIFKRLNAKRANAVPLETPLFTVPRSQAFSRLCEQSETLYLGLCNRLEDDSSKIAYRIERLIALGAHQNVAGILAEGLPKALNYFGAGVVYFNMIYRSDKSQLAGARDQFRDIDRQKKSSQERDFRGLCYAFEAAFTTGRWQRSGIILHQMASMLKEDDAGTLGPGHQMLHLLYQARLMFISAHSQEAINVLLTLSELAELFAPVDGYYAAFSDVLMGRFQLEHGIAQDAVQTLCMTLSTHRTPWQRGLMAMASRLLLSMPFAQALLPDEFGRPYLLAQFEAFSDTGNPNFSERMLHHRLNLSPDDEDLFRSYADAAKQQVDRYGLGHPKVVRVLLDWANHALSVDVSAVSPILDRLRGDAFQHLPTQVLGQHVKALVAISKGAEDIVQQVESARKAIEAKYSDSYPNLAELLYRSASYLYEAVGPQAALPHAQLAFSIYFECFGTRSEHFVKVCQLSCLILEACGDIATAIDYLDLLIKSMSLIYGQNDIELIEPLHRMSRMKLKCEDAESALQFAGLALTSAVTHYGEHSEAAIEVMTTLSDAYLLSGDAESAYATAQEILKMEPPGTDLETYIGDHFRMSHIAWISGDKEKAQKDITDAWNRIDQKPRPERPESETLTLVGCCHDVAMAYCDIGEYVQTQFVLFVAESLIEGIDAPDRKAERDFIHARTYFHMHQFEPSMKHLEAALCYYVQNCADPSVLLDPLQLLLACYRQLSDLASASEVEACIENVKKSITMSESDTDTNLLDIAPQALTDRIMVSAASQQESDPGPAVLSNYPQRSRSSDTQIRTTAANFPTSSHTSVGMTPHPNFPVQQGQPSVPAVSFQSSHPAYSGGMNRPVPTHPANSQHLTHSVSAPFLGYQNSQSMVVSTISEQRHSLDEQSC